METQAVVGNHYQPTNPSYTRRLWCCFEIAAFLRTRESGQKAHVIVRPTLLGPGFISIPVALSCMVLGMGFVPTGEKNNDHAVMWPAMAAIAAVVFYWSVAKMREFFRSVETLHHELKQFQCEDCLCYCCSIGHATVDGQTLLCDRRILLSCITRWFGSVQAFDSVVRSEVLTCLTEQLASQVFTYKEFVVMAVPVLWLHMDDASTPLDWILRPADGHTVWVDYEMKISARAILRGVGGTFGNVPLPLFNKVFKKTQEQH